MQIRHQAAEFRIVFQFRPRELFQAVHGRGRKLKVVGTASKKRRSASSAV